MARAPTIKAGAVVNHLRTIQNEHSTSKGQRLSSKDHVHTDSKNVLFDNGGFN